jgi:hypothetical protein
MAFEVPGSAKDATVSPQRASLDTYASSALEKSSRRKFAIRLLILSGIAALGLASWFDGRGAGLSRHSSGHSKDRSLSRYYRSVLRGLQQRRQQDDRGRPDKGNPGCDELAFDDAYYNDLIVDSGGDIPRSPCHNDDNIDDTFSDSDAEDGGPQGPYVVPQPQPPELGTGMTPPPNIVNLKVFVAIEPGRPSVARQVAGVLTVALNGTIGNMDFFFEPPPPTGDIQPTEEIPRDDTEEELSPPREDVGDPGNVTEIARDDPEEELSPPREDVGDPGNVTEIARDDPEEELSLPREDVGDPGNATDDSVSISPLQFMAAPRPLAFNIIYIQTESNLYVRSDRRWWWQYNIRYLCFWEDDATEVGAAVMRRITRNMTMTVDTYRDSIRESLREAVRDNNLLLQIFVPTAFEDDDMGNDDNEEEPASSPGSLDDMSEFLVPLNAQEWSWPRYLGIALFLSTFVGLVVTSQLGAVRRRHKVRQQVWGNLASEEGIKELLSTGWVLRDDEMEVFDKRQMGYRDDDSMLIGGFEQREPGPGTEIITQTTIAETSTRGGNSTSRGGNSTQEPSSSQP